VIDSRLPAVKRA